MRHAGKEKPVLNLHGKMVAIAGTLLFVPVLALAQVSLSLNQSLAGKGPGVWKTIPSCSGPEDALTFNSGDQQFGCNTITLFSGHLEMRGAMPSISTGSGAGKGASASLGPGSTDSAGWMSITTGTKPAPDTTVAVISTAQAVGPGHYWLCEIDPSNGNAAALHPREGPYVPSPAQSESSFSIVAQHKRLDPSTTYQWSYRCVELGD